MKEFISITIVIFSIVCRLSLVFANDYEMNYRTIAGKYQFTVKHFCTLDNGKTFNRKHKRESFKVAYYKSTHLGDKAGYDLYVLIKGDEVTGNIYRGPNRDSQRAYFNDYSHEDMGEIGYFNHQWISDKLYLSSQHSTITDGWKNIDGVLREYSCKVIRSGKMIEQIDYVVDIEGENVTDVYTFHPRYQEPKRLIPSIK